MSSVSGNLSVGMQHHREGRLVEARALYEEILQQHPDHPDALHMMGVLANQIGALETALNFIGRAIFVSPKADMPYANMASVLTSLGRYEDAIKVAEQGMTINPSLSDLYSTKADALVELDRCADAIPAYEEALKLSPDDAFVMASLGDALLAEGRKSEALQRFCRAVEKNPGHASAFESLVDIAGELLELGDDGVDSDARAALVIAHEAKDAKPRRAPVLTLLKHYLSAVPADGADGVLGVHLFRDRLRDHPDAATGLSQTEWLLGFKDVVVCNNEWHIIDDGTLYPDVAAHLATDSTHFNATLHGNAKAVLDATGPREKISGPVVLMGGCDNYYHWLFDHLPYLRILDAMDETKTMPVLINGDAADFQRDSLQAAGFDLSRLVGFADAALIECEDLQVPYFTHRRTAEWGTKDWWWRSTVTADIVQWLRDTFKVPATAEGRRLFLSRRDAQSRQCVNADEIDAIAIAAGYEIVEPGKLSFTDQVALFAGADRIAGIHGAGFSNLVFAPSGARVTEFIGGLNPPEFYEILSDVAGHTYNRVLCRITDLEGGVAGDRRYNHIVVDPDAAKAALAD